MTSNVQKFRAVERAGVLENVLQVWRIALGKRFVARVLRPMLMLYGCRAQNCSHNGFPVCTVVKDPTTKEERWLFDGMILRSQLLVILSRRVRSLLAFSQFDVELTTKLSVLSCGRNGMVLYDLISNAR
jgi:hypothetical protein